MPYMEYAMAIMAYAMVTLDCMMENMDDAMAM